MTGIVEAKRQELAALCRQRHVLRLSLFGSGIGDEFYPDSSDLDFLVEFFPASPAQRAERYFGLQEDLEGLLGVPVDLIEPGPIRNPYFKREVEETQILLYAAA